MGGGQVPHLNLGDDSLRTAAAAAAAAAAHGVSKAGPAPLKAVGYALLQVFSPEQIILAPAYLNAFGYALRAFEHVEAPAARLHSHAYATSIPHTPPPTSFTRIRRLHPAYPTSDFIYTHTPPPSRIPHLKLSLHHSLCHSEVLERLFGYIPLDHCFAFQDRRSVPPETPPVGTGFKLFQAQV